MNMFRNLFLAAAVMVVAPVVAGEEVGTVPVVVSPSVCAKMKSFMLNNTDKVASTLRFPVAVANYLASASKDGSKGRVATFFTGKEQIVSRMVAVVAVTGVIVGVYKVVQSLTAQEDDENVDEYDFGIFAEEDYDLEEEVN